MQISFIQSTFDEGEPEIVDVPDLDALGNALVDHASPEKGGAAWIAGASAGRTDGHVAEVSVWTLDYDGVEPDWSKLSHWRYIAHTTHSHCPERPCWRVIVELDQPCPGPEWKLRYKGKVLQHDLKSSTDGKTCNPSRIWYTPSENAKWRTNLEGEPASMPVISSDLSVSNGQPDLDDNADGLLNDGSAMWDAIERCMQTMPASVAGQGGDDRLFEAACVLRSSFRLTADSTLRALRIFNERCSPPWEDSRLAYKANQAAGDTQHTRGELIPPDVRSILKREAAPSTEAPAEGLFIDTSFDTEESLHVEWTCEALGITPGRPCMLYADPHAGKTTVQAELALAFATGTPAFGNLHVGPARQVVCLECEDDFDLRFHIGQFRGGRNLQPGMLLVTRVPLFFTAMEQIAQIFSDKPGLVLINSLRAFTPGLEENSSDFAAPMLQLAALSRKHAVPVWINHHTNKAGGVRGTSAIEAAAGNSWTLTKEGDARLMTHSASRMCSTRPPFLLELRPGALVRMDPPKFKANPEVEQSMQRIVERLRRADRWMSRSEVTKDLIGTKTTEAFAELVTHCQIARDNDRFHWNPKMDPKS